MTRKYLYARIIEYIIRIYVRDELLNVRIIVNCISFICGLFLALLSNQILKIIRSDGNGTKCSFWCNLSQLSALHTGILLPPAGLGGWHLDLSLIWFLM